MNRYYCHRPKVNSAFKVAQPLPNLGGMTVAKAELDSCCRPGVPRPSPASCLPMRPDAVNSASFGGAGENARL
jgi:hypothetical protein